MRKRKQRKKTKKYITVTILIFIITFMLLFIQYKKNVLPYVIEISKKYAVNEVNKKINNSIEKVVTELKLTSSDFFEKTFDEDKKINYFSADAILINKVCSKIANELSNEIKASESEKIELPIGLFSGLYIISAIGPNFSISILQAGDTTIDYETAFESQGINQVNFKIWLVAKTDITIVNPIYSKSVTVNRKIMIINTIFNGTVPETYLNIPKDTNTAKETLSNKN